MKKSINAWAVSGTSGFREMFADISAAGFDGIELTVDAEGASAHALTLSTTPETLAEIRRLSVEYHLPVVSIASSLYAGKMGSRNPEDRRFVQDVLEKQLVCAEALGSAGILVVPGGACPDIPMAEDYRTSLETLREMKPLIEKMKIQVGLENVWNGFFMSPFDMAGFIDRADCPYIGAYYDVGNVLAFSWSERWIEVLGDRIRLVHIKDYKRAEYINSGGRFVGLLEGDVNWPAVIPALQKAGFDGYLTAEVFRDDPSMSYPVFYRSVCTAIETILHRYEKKEEKTL